MVYDLVYNWSTTGLQLVYDWSTTGPELVCKWLVHDSTTICNERADRKHLLSGTVAAVRWMRIVPSCCRAEKTVEVEIEQRHIIHVLLLGC